MHLLEGIRLLTDHLVWLTNTLLSPMPIVQFHFAFKFMLMASAYLSTSLSSLELSLIFPHLP